MSFIEKISNLDTQQRLLDKMNRGDQKTKAEEEFLPNRDLAQDRKLHYFRSWEENSLQKDRPKSVLIVWEGAIGTYFPTCAV
jgi:hypothetical protein